MKKNQSNKIVSRLYEEFIIAQTIEDLPTYYATIEPIKKELLNITIAPGAIEVMSKENILKLCTMESRLRFIQLHAFMIYISNANYKINQN